MHCAVGGWTTSSGIPSPRGRACDQFDCAASTASCMAYASVAVAAVRVAYYAFPAASASHPATSAPVQCNTYVCGRSLQAPPGGRTLAVDENFPLCITQVTTIYRSNTVRIGHGHRQSSNYVTHPTLVSATREIIYRGQGALNPPMGHANYLTPTPFLAFRTRTPGRTQLMTAYAGNAVMRAARHSRSSQDQTSPSSVSPRNVCISTRVTVDGSLKV